MTLWALPLALRVRIETRTSRHGSFSNTSGTSFTWWRRSWYIASRLARLLTFAAQTSHTVSSCLSFLSRLQKPGFEKCSIHQQSIWYSSNEQILVYVLYVTLFYGLADRKVSSTVVIFHFFATFSKQPAPLKNIRSTFVKIPIGLLNHVVSLFVLFTKLFTKFVRVSLLQKMLHNSLWQGL